MKTNQQNLKKTLVVSASLKPYRYSNKAVNLLHDYGHEVVAIGQKKGEINGVEVLDHKIDITDVNTVSLYLSPTRQVDYYDYILSLNPKRIIMNPGAENETFKSMALSKGIEVVEHCTLVMLNMGVY